MVVFIGLMLALVGAIIAPWARSNPEPTPQALYQITAVGLLTLVMSLSQALESITRTYYARADLELLFSSPVSAAHVFGVRFFALVLANTALSSALFTPAIAALVYYAGPHWLSAYPVLFGINLLVGGVGMLIALALFKVAGPKRTRNLAQAIAGIIGALFMVGMQFGILSYSKSAQSSSGALGQWLTQHAALVPDFILLPARGAMGDPLALGATLFAAFTLALASLWLAAPGFSRTAIAATGHERVEANHRRPPRFKQRTQTLVLFRKEVTLIWRDPWLLSQVLTQLLYLLVPATILWLQFNASGARAGLLAAIIVMAGSQLAGGIAWLTISAEDAPDLIETAPMSYKSRLRAKTMAVFFYALAPTAPLIAWLSFASPMAALYSLAALVCGVFSTILVHRAFSTRARRAQFARRHTASRITTLIEAMVSIIWAGSAAAALLHPVAGIVAAIPALLILVGVRTSRRAAFRMVPT